MKEQFDELEDLLYTYFAENYYLGYTTESNIEYIYLKIWTEEVQLKLNIWNSEEHKDELLSDILRDKINGAINSLLKLKIK